VLKNNETKKIMDNLLTITQKKSGLAIETGVDNVEDRESEPTRIVGTASRQAEVKT